MHWVMFKRDVAALVAKYLPESIKRHVLYELQWRVVSDKDYQESWEKAYDPSFTQMMEKIQ